MVEGWKTNRNLKRYKGRDDMGREGVKKKGCQEKVQSK